MAQRPSAKSTRTSPAPGAGAPPKGEGAQTPAAAEPRAWPADRTERWPLERLNPYAGNARTHSKQQVAELVAAIKEWGFTTAVLVDENGTIIAGHGRMLAAKELGLKDVPVMVARGWTDAQKKAYVIADNKLALNAGWDDTLLAAEVLDLKGMEFDVALTGLSEKELAELLPDESEGGSAGEKSGGRTQQAVIAFNIVFDDEEQQRAWFEFVRQLKVRYPDEETLGRRLARFVGESPPAAATFAVPPAAGEQAPA